jgi:hypothetical protein
VDEIPVRRFKERREPIDEFRNFTLYSPLALQKLKSGARREFRFDEGTAHLSKFGTINREWTTFHDKSIALDDFKDFDLLHCESLTARQDLIVWKSCIVNVTRSQFREIRIASLAVIAKTHVPVTSECRTIQFMYNLWSQIA